MSRTKDNIQYSVSVGANGIGYETMCNNLADARELYRYRKATERSKVRLIKYNHTRGTNTIVNRRLALKKLESIFA